MAAARRAVLYELTPFGILLAIRSRPLRSGSRYSGTGVTYGNAPRRYGCEALRPGVNPLGKCIPIVA